VDGPGRIEIDPPPGSRPISVRPSPRCTSYVPPTWLQSAFALNVPSAWNSIVYVDWSASGTTPWNAGVVSVIPVSFHLLPSSSAGRRAPAPEAPAVLDWALDATAGRGPHVIVPPAAGAIVSVSGAAAYVAAAARGGAR